MNKLEAQEVIEHNNDKEFILKAVKEKCPKLKFKMLQKCQIKNARFSKVAFVGISPKNHFSKNDKNVIRLKIFF